MLDIINNVTLEMRGDIIFVVIIIDDRLQNGKSSKITVPYNFYKCNTYITIKFI